MSDDREPLHTAAEVESYLQGALAVVAELNPEPALREACFTKAVDLLSALAPEPTSLRPSHLSGRGRELLHG